MTKEELIKKLKDIDQSDPEAAHGKADDLLIEYINDPEVAEAYSDIPKWYA